MRSPARSLLCVRFVVVVVATLILPFVALNQITRALSNGPFYVAPTGNDGNDCLSWATACQSIGAAIGKATNGSAIFIADGIYYEQLNLDKDLTLVGAGQATTIIHGADAGRVITIPVSTTVNLYNLAVQHGAAAEGAGVYNQGTLLLSSSTIAHNAVTQTGGGIWNSGTLIALHSAVVDNSAGDNATAGGIWNSGVAILNNSQINNNSITGECEALSFKCSAGIENHGMLTFSDSEASGNQGGYHGASAVLNFGTTVVANSVFTANLGGLFFSGGVLMNAGGSFILDDSVVRDNWVGGVVNGSVMTITRSLIENNQAGGSTFRDGGGILNSGMLTIYSTTIRNNRSGDYRGVGGGIVNYEYGTLHLSGSAIVDNRAGAGLGLYNLGTALITNTTFGGNQQIGGGDVGAIFNAHVFYHATLTMTNATVAGNFGGIDTTITTSVWMKNTLVANNGTFNCQGGVASLGHNLDSGNTCNFSSTGDLTNTNPLLAPLADYGGGTPTYALLARSPAIDAGDNAGCPATDQRGYPRPQGIACDIGAFESFGPIWLPLILTSAAVR